MTSDLELLGQFAWEKSQDAFTALVNRHVNLVYSAALRQVRSPQLAEEITQSVFTDLARDAEKLKPETILTAWLYAVTRRTAIDVIRKESRRQLREQIAVEMNAMNATSADWTQIEPLLDDALAALEETDRSAILLRYFENKNLREVGLALGTSDDAAQKRVSRAVEQLREFFSKRNVTIGASGLAVLISANAVSAAPIGLAATISAAAILTGTAVQTSTIIAATKTIAMTTLQKTVITGALAAAIGTGIFEAHQAAQLREQNQTLQQQQTTFADQLQHLQADNEILSNRLAHVGDSKKMPENPNTELLKLRGEVGVLRRQLNEAEQNLAATLSTQAKFASNEDANRDGIKYIGLDLFVYAGDHTNQFPGSLDQLDRIVYSDTNLPPNMPAFDYLNVGQVKFISQNNPEHPNMVMVRERIARQAPDGTWHRAYLFADGSVHIATSYDGNFEAWEKVNTYSPPPNQ